MKNDNTKYAEARMLIRKPVSEVFEAFINPELTKNFWFSKSSGKLEANKSVTWAWEMHNVSTPVFVREVLQNKKIAIDWDKPPTMVDFIFKPVGDNSTYVTIRHYGFTMADDELVAVIRDSTSGFTDVLAGLKAFMEHNIRLNLIEDKFPKELGGFEAIHDEAASHNDHARPGSRE